jgi:hypothetical protein
VISNVRFLKEILYIPCVLHALHTNLMLDIFALRKVMSNASCETRSHNYFFLVKLYRQSDRRLSAKLVPTFADRWCHVVSVTDPYGRILGSLDRSRYFFFQIAPQLYSQGWMCAVPDPLLVIKSRSAQNQTRTSGSVARNSDHWITEAVCFLLHNIYKFSSYLTASTLHVQSVARHSDH